MHQARAALDRRPASRSRESLSWTFVGVFVLASFARADQDRGLVAHWTLDHIVEGVCVDASGNGWDASIDGGRRGALARARGVHAGSVTFRGDHLVTFSAKADFGSLAAISLSAWTRPSELGGYREIFRKEDGDRRVLFSFQHGGSILALGLNVGGYVECDARIDPARILDGAWHHCAATFDGEWMRVYVDGGEVGSLRRSGRLVAGGAARGAIGSSNGSECFQGEMDDLRIYRRALSADEIAAMWKRGIRSVKSLTDELAGQVDAVYSSGGSFAEALAGTRREILVREPAIRRDLAAMVLGRLRADFPTPYATFVRHAGVRPVDYLTSTEGKLDERLVGRFVELMVEYRPVTDGQRAKLTAAERRRWAEVAAIEAKFEELRARGDAARFSPEWIEIVVAAAQRVDFRPSVSEAVAPYVPPATVPTRTLSAAEARAALEADWLHQAGRGASAETIRREIRWTRHLATRLTEELPETFDVACDLAKLDQIERKFETRLFSESAFDRELYFEVRTIKRAIVFANPVIDFDRVLFVDMPFPQGSEWPHETRHRLGYMAVPGGRLLVLEGLSPSGSLKQLMPKSPLHGSFWRPDVSYDGDKVLVSFKPHNEKSFHLYEIAVDGSGLEQLTDGPYDDLDPIYLPDGEHIAFSTTRGHTYVRCMPPTNAYVLARCDRLGDDIYLISRNNEPDYLPSVLNDGRIVYTRWEYTDKPLWRAQGLWTMNPDGTQVNTLWGNQSVWPDLLKDVRSIPGSRRVMFTGSAHHNWFSGTIGIIDPGRGFNFPSGITKVTADLPWPESGDGPVDPVESATYHSSGSYSAYYSPYPLSERDFLVSAKRGDKFVLYLMDVDGNRELVYEGAHNLFHAIPLRPRPRPPVIPDRVDWPDREHRRTPARGVIFSDDVCEGATPELREKVQYLRVLAIDPKTYTYWHKRPYISTGPVVSMVQSDGVKRVLGTVPVERDGSVAFWAPSGKALHFQLLDENYRALQTMRSFTGVMPGEYRGCVGCHESHSRAPQNVDRSIAPSRSPREITPPPWGEETVSYERFVQPVLDEHCGSCHQGDGGARKTLDLTLRPGFLMFPEPYVTLTGKPTWGKPYTKPDQPPPGFGIAGTLFVEGYDTRDPKAYRTPQPMTSLSYKSPLIDLASSGEHYGVRVDPVSLRKLIAWVDTMCPLRGDEEVRKIPDPEFQGIDWLSIRPEVRSAPTVVRPGPVD